MKFSSMLKHLIRDKGITLKLISEHTGISRSTLSDWMNGSNPRNLEEVRSLADYLEISIEELIFGERHSVNLNSVFFNSLESDSIELKGEICVRLTVVQNSQEDKGKNAKK